MEITLKAAVEKDEIVVRKRPRGISHFSALSLVLYTIGFCSVIVTGDNNLSVLSRYTKGTVPHLGGLHTHTHTHLEVTILENSRGCKGGWEEKIWR